MNNEATDITLWAYTAGRYKGKSVKLEKEIARLREEIDRHIRTQDCLRHILALIVEDVGDVVIPAEALDRAVPLVQMTWSEVEQTYTLRAVETKTE